MKKSGLLRNLALCFCAAGILSHPVFSAVAEPLPLSPGPLRLPVFPTAGAEWTAALKTSGLALPHALAYDPIVFGLQRQKIDIERWTQAAPEQRQLWLGQARESVSPELKAGSEAALRSLSTPSELDEADGKALRDDLSYLQNVYAPHLAETVGEFQSRRLMTLAKRIASNLGVDHLRYLVAFDPSDDSISPVLAAALSLVAAAPPKNLSIERVPNSQNFDFIIEVTDSDKIKKDLALHRMQGALINPESDAYTMILAHAPRGPYIVRLLWDRLTTEVRSGRCVEKADAFTRIVAALAHEIYGNVRTFSDRKETLADPQHRYSDRLVKSDQIAFELAAFQAGIEFLTRTIEKFGPSLLPKTQQDLKAALARERKGLDSWKSAVP